MTGNFPEEKVPKFYGSATVGERGQVVIPAQARTDLNVTPGSKLLVFGGPHGHGLMIVKPEDMTEFVTKAMSYLSKFSEIVEGSGS